MDDEIIHSVSDRNAWDADHHIATCEAYPVIQDAARKRLPPSQSAGAWTGPILHTNETDIMLLVRDGANTKIIVLRFQAQVLENSEVDLCTQ